MTAFSDICAVLITRGDTDLNPILDTLPYGEVLVVYPTRTVQVRGAHEGVEWIHEDRKVYGRFRSAEYTDKSVVYFQDDDVVLKDHDGLLKAYNERRHLGTWVANTQPGLDEAQGYHDLALVGCGSLVPRDIIVPGFARLPESERDERFDLDCDFIFGVLTPWEKVDLGLEVLEVASAPNRLWRQPKQQQGKHASINKARALRTVVLTMLTKNEQANIVRALSSARPLYDSVLIHDTGSTDDTVLEAARWCSANGVPHRIVENVPFEGFGPNRQRLFDDARTLADYQLLMDGDEEFSGEVHLPPLFTDSYLFHYGGNLDYAQPRLLYSNFPWRWANVKRHASLDGRAYDGREPIGCDVNGLFIEHHGTDNSNAERYQTDIDGLTEDLDAGIDTARSLFMRGKAYEGLCAATGDEKYRDLAMADYTARLEISTGDEEAFYSRFRLGCLLVESGRFASGVDELFHAWMDRPRRIESLRAISAYCTAVADAAPYPTGDMLIVHRDLYQPNSKEE